MAIYLKAARVNAGLTQIDVCKEINISKNTLISYEKYESAPPVDRAEKMAALYGMTLDDIIWRKE